MQDNLFSHTLKNQDNILHYTPKKEHKDFLETVRPELKWVRKENSLSFQQA